MLFFPENIVFYDTNYFYKISFSPGILLKQFVSHMNISMLFSNEYNFIIKIEFNAIK